MDEAVRERARMSAAPVGIVLGLCLLAWVAVALLRKDWVPASDWATIESRVRDVGTRWTPTEGAWSRYDWNHPGPLVFYALAPLYRLGGGAPEVLRVGGLLISTAFLSVVALLLLRAGRTVLAIGLLSFVLTVFALPEPFLTDYWNPALAVFASGAVLLAAWACLDGWAAGLPILVGTWSWCVQAHLGFGTVLAPAVLIGVVAALVRLRHHPKRRVVVVLSAALGAAMWLPALLDSVVDPPGNLMDIVDWAVSTDVPPAGEAAALGFVSNATDLARPPWERFPVLFSVALTNDEATLPGGLIVLLLAAGAVAAALRLRSELHLVALCAVTWVSAVLSVSRITGPLHPWILWWVHPLVACTWLAIALVAVRWAVRLVPALRAARQVGQVGALGLAGLLLVSALVVSVRSDFYWYDVEAVTLGFRDVVKRWAEDTPVVVEMAGDDVAGLAVLAGLVADLKRDGHEVYVPAEFEPQFGRRHARADTAAYPAVFVSVEGLIEEPPLGYEVLAVDDPLSEAERLELGRLTLEMRRLFVEAGWEAAMGYLDSAWAEFALLGAPPEVAAARPQIERIAELRARGRRFVLYGREALP